MPDEPLLPPSLLPLLHEHSVALGSKSYRLLTIGNLDALLDTLKDDAEVPYWCILWDSAVALSLWMLDQPDLLRGKRVLELGTGLGLCTLVAQELGAQVVQTDNHAPALRLAAENARRNALPIPEQFLADWRDWHHEAGYDVILGSDIVYERPVHDLLLSIFVRNLSPGGCLLLADPFRESGWEMAERLTQEGWTVDLQSRHIPGDSKPLEILILHATRAV